MRKGQVACRALEEQFLQAESCWDFLARNVLHENRDLAGEDLSLVIEAAAVAFASQHLCIVL